MVAAGSAGPRRRAFRRALAAVWAFDSPRYRDREALLEELGEFRKVTLRIVVEPRTFNPADGVEWRSFNVEGLREQPHLAGLLRGIADQLDTGRERTNGRLTAPSRNMKTPRRTLRRGVSTCWIGCAVGRAREPSESVAGALSVGGSCASPGGTDPSMARWTVLLHQHLLFGVATCSHRTPAVKGAHARERRSVRGWPNNPLSAGVCSRKGASTACSCARPTSTTPRSARPTCCSRIRAPRS